MPTLGDRWARIVALGVAGATGLLSCTAPPKGALILAVSTDMQIPKDLDVISVFVATDGVAKFDFLGRVPPDGTIDLPATLAVVEPDDPGAQVRIRVTAFQTQPGGDATARVVRDVLTTVPHERTALLRVPLNFLDTGSATGTLPAALVPDPMHGKPEGDTVYDPTTLVPSDPGYLRTTCDFTRGQTSVAGSCAQASVDPSALPGYVLTSVFGEGGTEDKPSCFPVGACFANAVAVDAQTLTTAADGSCSFPIAANESGADWNCALATTDGTGDCSSGRCMVPLESDPGEGFTVQAGHAVLMVPGVCKRIAEGATLYLDRTSCATKVEASPVCQPAIMVGSSGPTDGGGGCADCVDAALRDGSGRGSVDAAAAIPAADAGAAPVDGGA